MFTENLSVNYKDSKCRYDKSINSRIKKEVLRKTKSCYCPEKFYIYDFVLFLLLSYGETYGNMYLLYSRPQDNTATH